MAETTGISWADHTFNPWIGCTEVSAGCDNCYARDFTRNRMGLGVWGAGVPRRRTSVAYWRQAAKWSAAALAAGVRRRAFPSMCDPFDAEVPAEWRSEFLALCEATPGLDWLLLTKRPNLVRKMVPALWLKPGGWPANVWVGTSIEDDRVLWRVADLCKVPAAVRFLSCEPLLGPIDISTWLYSGWNEPPFDDQVDWVIVGGESGPKRRPFELEWAEDLREQCEIAEVAFWFKQVGALRSGQGEDALGRVYQELPVGRRTEDSGLRTEVGHA